MDNLINSIPLSPDILARTPPEVIELILHLLTRIKELEARIEELEARLNKNSTNSNKPPSSDPPSVQRKAAPQKSNKPRKHKGHRQQYLPPTEVLELHPQRCSCGCNVIDDQEHYYTHQVIELPEIQPVVKHLLLHRGKCPRCGKTVKAYIPDELRTGFGPRISALVAELTAVCGNSRRMVQDTLHSVLGIPISQGALQNVMDRVSEAISPHYTDIGEVVRSMPVNHIDETTWKRGKTLEWLWLMCNKAAAYFMLHSSRSKAAFQELVRDWQGILVSDGYGVYKKWVHGRQTCLAHLIREAKGLSERTNIALSRPGAWILNELRSLCHMAEAKPTVGQWNMFYARLMRLMGLYHDRQDEAGQLVRRLQRELDNLWLFLSEEGVSPTNNHAERTLRFAVLWRKRSFGSKKDKGDRFVERLLSLRQTCRFQGKRTFKVLVEAMQSFLSGKQPDTSWIRSLVPTTP